MVSLSLQLFFGWLGLITFLSQTGCSGLVLAFGATSAASCTLIKDEFLACLNLCMVFVCVQYA